MENNFILSIVIPHYKEEFSMVNKLLTSIDNQRLIPKNSIEVIIVNDCGVPLNKKDFNYKNINPRLIKTKKNAGVGVARQRGIDSSNGKFIMFIDADDVLNSNHSLFYILSAIHKDPDTELFFGNFIEEQVFEEQWMLYLHDKNLTFCHGKVYSKDYLTREDIKCHPTLRYNEDSYFNALVFYCATKIKYIENPLVVWCNNPNSTVRDGGLYAYKKLPNYVQSVNDLCAELIKRKKPYAIQFLQSLYYIYFQLQDEAWKLNRVRCYRNDVIVAARKFYNNYKDVFKLSGETERLNLYNESRKGFAVPIQESFTFDEFIKELESND